MVATAKIQINNSKNSGNISSSDGSDIQREILSELKKMNELNKKTSSMSASGLLGTAGKLGGIIGGVAGAASLLPGAIGGAIESYQSGFQSQQDYGYSKVQTEDGENKVAKINQKNGEIVDLLTMQEAAEQGILDDKMDILNKHKVVSSAWDDHIIGLASNKDAIMLSNEKLLEIADLEDKESKIQSDIVDIKQKKLDSLGGMTDYTQGFSSAFGSGNGSMPSGSVQQIMDEANKIYPKLQEFQQKNYGITLESFMKIR